MKTIKRVLALVLCAALLLALFAGCNKNQDADNKDGSNSGTGDKSGITPDGLTDLQTGSVGQGIQKGIRTAIQADTVNQCLTSAARTDNQTYAVFPDIIQMMCLYPGTRDYQVTGTDRSQNAFPRNGKPGLDRKLITAGQDHQLADGAGPRSGTKQLPAGFFLSMKPAQRSQY